MALADLLNLSKERKKVGISEERIQAIVPQMREYIAFGVNTLICLQISC